MTKQELIDKIGSIYKRLDNLEDEIKSNLRELGKIKDELTDIPEDPKEIIDDIPEEEVEFCPPIENS